MKDVIYPAGIIEREIQELPAQGGRQPGEGEEVAGVLRVPERRQGRQTPAGFATQRGRRPAVPRFHLVRPPPLHSVALSGRRCHPPELLPVVPLLQ